MAAFNVYRLHEVVLFDSSLVTVVTIVKLRSLDECFESSLDRSTTLSDLQLPGQVLQVGSMSALLLLSTHAPNSMLGSCQGTDVKK